MFKETIIFLYCFAFVVQSQVLIPKSFNDYYLSLKQLNPPPVFKYIDNSEYNVIPENYVYKIMSDKNQNSNQKQYVVVKSKTLPFDVGPYELIQRLDEIKYMVLWLNLYCSMHPDCDKIKLNEELKKMVSTILQK